VRHCLAEKRGILATVPATRDTVMVNARVLKEFLPLSLPKPGG
jgi:hypothetical protein